MPGQYGLFWKFLAVGHSKVRTYRGSRSKMPLEKSESGPAWMVKIFGGRFKSGHKFGGGPRGP